MVVRVPTNNDRGRGSGPCLPWGGLDKALRIVPTTLFLRVQRLKNGIHSTSVVKEPSTRPMILLMITRSYCRRRRRLAIFEQDKMKFAVPLTLLGFRLDHHRRSDEWFLLRNILETIYYQIWTEIPSITWRTSQNFSGACNILTLCQFYSDLNIFRMEIIKVSTTSSKTRNWIRNVI